MSRCDYDTVFYRVFCVTLLIVASAFTVILTNVFIDIDGLLLGNGKGQLKAKHNQDITHENNAEAVTEDTEKTEDFYRNSNNIEDKDNEDVIYRSKRAVESQNILFHFKNPKVKTVLTNQLAKLLEELDKEESVTDNKELYDVQANVENNSKDNEGNKEKNRTDNENINRDKIMATNDENMEEENAEDELLHITMHNILLQGIIGHMDLSEVYKKVHNLIERFKNDNVNGDKTEHGNHKSEAVNERVIRRRGKPINVVNEENKFFREIIKCKQLQNDIKMSKSNEQMKDIIKYSSNIEPNVIIKTLIDIKSLNKEKKESNDTIPMDGVKGIIKLIYNGKPVKFNQIDEGDPMNIDLRRSNSEIKGNEDKLSGTHEPSSPQKLNYSYLPKMLLNKVLVDYLKKFPVDKNSYSRGSESKNYEVKRLKRHVRVRFEKGETTTKKTQSEIKNKDGKDEDELYVEIETHIDNKGMKGERKNKLIRNLIDKIQKAIHSDTDTTLKKKSKHLHVKKRIQNPLNKNETDFLKKLTFPIDNIATRHLNPLNKVTPITDDLPSMLDKSGEKWRKKYIGPKFFSLSKSINSGEMRELDLDYSRILESTGIPQRLQKPLNMDSEETKTNTYQDLGNMKFYIKDLEGTGFSIGFNQFVDEVPDSDAILSNIDDIVKTYQQADLREMDGNVPINFTPTEIEKIHELSKRDIAHIENHIKKRSPKENDYHSNDYKIIFNNDFLPYDNYQEIYEDKNKKVTVSLKKELENSNPGFDNNNIKVILNNVGPKEFPIIIDDDILNRNLKPLEIFGLADLIDRKKRSVNIYKISNTKNMKRLNKFINTNAKINRKIFFKNKRNKRQIGKIRIIARDNSDIQKASDENVYVISDEKVLADRAIVKEAEAPEHHEMPEEKVVQENYEFIPSYPVENHDFGQPIAEDLYKRSRHNNLMSKYPHIFLEEISKSKEEDVPLNSFTYNKIVEEPNDIDIKPELQKSQIFNPTLSLSNPNIGDMFKALAPDPANYKLTVKLLPKNTTDANPGFKEVHTSINKSFHNHGMRYSSLVNVSEISKIEELNKTKDSVAQFPLVNRLTEQQERLKVLLKQHKDKLDQQLNKLRNEKKKLLEAIVSTTEKEYVNKETIEAILPVNPSQVIQLSNDDINKLVSTALLRLQETTTMAQTTTTSTTTTSAPTTESDTSKVQILRTIEKNEKLTNMILERIDRNTEILQTFLKKLQDTPIRRKELPDSILAKAINEFPKSIDDAKNFQIHEPFFSQTMPKLEAFKNDTHVSIPFVYAYQQPYNLDNEKPENPVASVVYHGHIHTNAINKNKLKEVTKTPTDFKLNAVKNGWKRDANVSKFFIDELENDYKVLTIGQTKNKLVFPVLPVKVNSTI